MTTTESEIKWIAGFWQRIGAFLIDSIILGVIGLVLGYFCADTFVALGAWGRLLGFSIALVYFALLNSSLGNGQTLGKRILKLRVVDAENKTISLARSLGRYCILGIPFFLNGAVFYSLNMPEYWQYVVAVIVFGGCLSIVYLYLFNTVSRQSFHDLIFGTYVVQQSVEAKAPGKVWRVHLFIVALFFIVAGISPLILAHFLKKNSFADLVNSQRAIMAHSDVAYATLNYGNTYTKSSNAKTQTTSFINAHIFLKKNRLEDNDLARQFATFLKDIYPEASEKNLIAIDFVYGYDIGIAAKWSRRRYEFTPCQLEDFDKENNNANESDVEAGEEIPERLRLLISQKYTELDSFYNTLQKNYEEGIASEKDLYEGFSELYENNPSNEKNFNGWVLNNFNSYAAITARGSYYYRMAKFVRGGKFSSHTPECRFRKMNDYLDQARTDLNLSRTMTTKPYMSILYLLNSAKYDQSSEELRKLLDEGNSIAPDNWYVRNRYMLSIVPKWGGSYNMMHDFLKESAGQGVSEEHLTILESEIYADQVERVEDQHAKDEAFTKLKSIIDKTLSNGWKFSYDVLDTYVREATHRKLYADSRAALNAMAKEKNSESWIYSRLGWLYMKLGGSYEARQAYLAECAAQGMSEEHLAIIESNIDIYQLHVEKDLRAREEILGQLKLIVEKSQSMGWKFSNDVMETYAREMLDRQLFDDALVALNILAKGKADEAWIYSNLGWIYLKKHQMPEAWKYINIAARMGNAWSQFSVGKTLYTGCADINLSPDQAAGLMWMQRSADQNFDEAKAFLMSNSQ